MLDAPALQQRVEVPGAVGRPVVGHDPLHGDAQPLVERERPGHEAAGRALPLVGQQLGVGDAAVVVDRHVQAREPGPARGAAAAPEGPVAAAVGYARHLLDVDVDELPGALALVAHGRHGAAPPHLARDAVDVGQAGQAVPGDDPGARAGRHARLGRQGERRQQHGPAGLAGALLDLGGGVSLASLRGRLLRSASPSPRLARASHLEAVWRLTPIWRAASATPRPDPMRDTSVSRPFGVSFALGCWDMGGPSSPGI